ncbi:MAG TPA: flagellar hook-length control protein FliK, partial [Gammaproteobacteria bacterium]|nr:flagellar hook-length control protein FliK [Gammaproteobacteria bacterium]
MELQQTISQNINTIERQSSNTNSLFENSTVAIDTDKKTSFKDSLKDEIKQVKVKNSNEKTDKNQKDKIPEQDVKKADNKPVKNQEDDVKIVDKSNANEIREKLAKNKDIEPKNSQDIENEVPDEKVVDDLSGEVLPSIQGSELPFYTPEAQLDDSSVVLSDANEATNMAVPVNLAQDVDIDMEIVLKQQIDAGNQKQMVTNKDVPLILADKQPVKPLNVTVPVSEKVQIQDTVFNKLMSEMPSGEVITQASRLQQVPSVTAVTNGVIGTKNTALNPMLETGLVNTAPQSGKVLSSAIATNIQNPNWPQQLTQQVSYMIKGGIQQAEIKLNPANLGPMEIKLSLQDDQASVQFVTQHVVVRDALDAAIPKLK